MKKIARFINTFVPVIPLYEEIYVPLSQRNIYAKFLISSGLYRGNEDTSIIADNFIEKSWVPKSLRRNKRATAIVYFFMALFSILFKKADLHVFLTQPPMFYVAGAWLSRVKKVPYVIHLMDMYPDVLFAHSPKRKSALFGVLDHLSLEAYKNASAIVVLGRCMRDRLIGKGVPEELIHLVHNWSSVDDASFKSAPEPNPLRVLNNLSGQYVVMYSGNMGVGHDLEDLLKVSESLCAFKGLSFLLVGKGVGRVVVEEYIRQRRLNNVQLWDYQPIDKLPQLISLPDVHYVSLRPGFEGLMVPSKLYSILACGRPIIFQGSEKSEVARIINEFKCGVVVPPKNHEKLTEAVKLFYDNKIFLHECARNSLKAYKEFSKSKMIQKYISIVEGAVK